MRALRFAFVPLFVTACTPARVDEARSPVSAAASSARVAFTRGPHGHVLVPVTSQHRSTLFLLDSGASGDGVTPAFAKELGLAPRGKATAIGAGGQGDDAEIVTIPELDIGGFTFAAHEGTVNEFAPDQPNVGGIFGRDLFERVDVEVDLAKNLLTLSPPGSTRSKRAPAFTRVPFADATGLMKIAVRLDGEEIAAIVDLGAMQSVVDVAAAKKSGFDPGAAPIRGMAMGADGHPIAVAQHAFQEARVGELAVAQPTFIVGDLPVFEALGLKDAPAMILGLDVLANKTIAFDAKDHEIALSR